MRTIGTVVRGVRAPIIREGDNIAEVAAASVMEAWKEAGIEPRDRDVVAVVAHMAVQKIAVGHVLMPRVHRPGMARRRGSSAPARRSRSAPSQRRGWPPPRTCRLI